MAVLEKGKRNVEMLKARSILSSIPVEKQVAIIYLGTKGLLRNVPVDKITEFETQFLATLEQKHPEVLETFRKGKLDKDAVVKVEALAADISKQFS